MLPISSSSVLQKLIHYSAITIAIDCNGLSLLIFTKQWLVFGASAFQCMHAGFLCRKCDNFACLHNRQYQNELHMKRLFFFLPKSVSSVSLSVAIFPSVVQAYTQPYSIGGRIKLIACQIRHELSVIIHEISTSWKKRLGCGPYSKHIFV